MLFEGLFALPRFGVVGLVVGGMASLTPDAEIIRLTVGGIVVKVGDGKDNSASGNGVEFAIAGVAVGIGGASFTLVAGPFKVGFSDGFPVAGVS